MTSHLIHEMLFAITGNPSISVRYSGAMYWNLRPGYETVSYTHLTLPTKA